MSITTVGLRRTFGDVIAVDEISIEVPSGKVTGLVGPNGAGKTTLLLMLAGLLAPDKGTVNIAGINLAEDPTAARSCMGWMPDEFGIWDSLTATEFLTTFGATYGQSKSAAANRAVELLQLVHLEEFAKRPVRVLSRGQKQRLGLARALVNKPSVLLLDEPANGMDPRSRIELRTLLQQLAQEGATILVSSHVLSELEDMIDSAIFISRGRNLDTAELTASSEDELVWEVTILNPHTWMSWADEQKISWQPTASSHTFRVKVTNAEAAADLVTAAANGGVRWQAFAPVNRSLEEIYMSLEGDRK